VYVRQGLKIAIALALSVAQSALAQSPVPPSTQSRSGGMATSAPQAAVFDSQHRAITAGGFVKSGPIVFQDVAKSAGLTTWHHSAGTPKKEFILEAKGPGVCLLDYDNDGWLDIYLVNGANFDVLAGKSPAPHAALFRNNHDGTFTDVTQKAGAANDRWGFGCVVADYDNDGYPDIYVSNFGKNRLYRNNHDGTFKDVAEQAGVDVDKWSTGATFGDYDGDGKLDLFVAGYLQFDWKNPPKQDNVTPLMFCQYRGIPVMCGPRGMKGERDTLYHNNGDGTFTDVSKKLGVDNSAGYFGLGALFVDVNNDGKLDLLVANDTSQNYEFINKGNGTFEDKSVEDCYALNGAGREMANMGIAVADYQNNGNLAVVNTDFSDDYDVLFQNDGTGYFTDVSYEAGLMKPTMPFVGFGDGFLDFDNDGWQDLLFVNGHVYPEADKHPEWGSTYAQRPLLFHNLKNGKFDLMPAVEGTGLAVVSVGRGAAFGDIFNDGKMSVIINNMDGVPVLLRNVNSDHHHWIELHLIGGPKSPHDAVGTTVYLNATGIRQRQDVLSGGSYLSSNDMRIHFGFGDSTDPGTAEIHWPSGAKETIKLPAADRIYTIEEGKGVITSTLCDSKTCDVVPAGAGAKKN
jgi:enediyne biosynthesis protein E4